MKRLLTILVIASSCTGNNKFAELDRLVENYENTEEKSRFQIDSMRSLYVNAETESAKWDCAYELFLLYKNTHLDSSFVYSNKLAELAGKDESRILKAQSAHIINLLKNDQISEAEKHIGRLKLPNHYSESDVVTYFGVYDQYLSKAISDIKEKGSALLNLSNKYHEYAQGSDRATLIQARAMMYLGYHDKALQLILDNCKGREIPSLYFTTLALIYEDLGKSRLHEEYLIKASCNSLVSGSKDYYCLYQLANNLFKIGDYERACKYMHRTIKDALSMNYPSGLKRSAMSSLIMNTRIQEIHHSRIKLLHIIYIFLFVCVIILACTIYYMKRLLKAKKITTNKYRHAVETLNEVSTIKDNMLGEFMEMSSKYIYMIDSIKNEYRKTLNREGVEGLKSLLHEPSFADKEFLNFYKAFDKTFLNVFPSFVDDVNSLMSEDNRFKTEAQSLDTGLRILALIRLGINDSTRISNILHISKGTVYSYRYSMRRDAKDPAQFEDRIKSL